MKLHEPTKIRWTRQAEEAKIRKEIERRERAEKELHDAWADAWTRAGKRHALTEKLEARWSRPLNYSETDRRARRVLVRAFANRQPRRPWKP